MKIIDGSKIADKILLEAKTLREQSNLHPGLAIINIGGNPASTAYIKKKIAAGSITGVTVSVHNFAQFSLKELRKVILQLNAEANINGIIVQMPVTGFDPLPAFSLIAAGKDVDGLNPLSLGSLWQTGSVPLIPATPAAIIKVLEEIAREETLAKNAQANLPSWIKGKHAVIINRSAIIGKPLAALLLHLDCTVTIAHSKSGNLDNILENADIVVSATGKKYFLRDYPLKKNAVIIDAGFVKEEGAIFGDVNIESVKEKASWLSPVPNGIGPIGVAMLIANTVQAAKIQTIPAA